jgi:hypothetical protein
LYVKRDVSTGNKQVQNSPDQTAEAKLRDIQTEPYDPYNLNQYNNKLIINVPFVAKWFGDVTFGIT